jgi:hypothetical protein
MHPDSISDAFVAACRSAGVTGLRLHDLRAEGVSRLFERGLDLARVRAVSRHKSSAILRYIRAGDVEELAKALGLATGLLVDPAGRTFHYDGITQSYRARTGERVKAGWIDAEVLDASPTTGVRRVRHARGERGAPHGGVDHRRPEGVRRQARGDAEADQTAGGRGGGGRRSRTGEEPHRRAGAGGEEAGRGARSAPSAPA